MQLTLHLPGLLMPHAVLSETVFDLRAPGLEWLLGRSQRELLPGDWLVSRCGAESPLPAAALRKAGVEGSPISMEPSVLSAEPKLGAGSTGNHEWLCLDPVHWAVTREGITLADPKDLSMHETETTALIDSLAPLFAAWGTLSASAPTCWELQLSRPLALCTQPLSSAIGLPIDPELPGGEHGATWRRLIAEAQVLLHAHPVNRSRAARNHPLINSLWPWGQGTLPKLQPTIFDVLWTDDPVLAGLATLNGRPCLPPPKYFQPASGEILAVVTHLDAPARERNALAWREALLMLERDWFSPLQIALKQRILTRCRIIGSNPFSPETTSWVVKKGDCLRFWRRPHPLTDLR